MGACNSCEATAVAPATAKVVLLDGRLQEFVGPVKASHVLQKDDSMCFVCSSDDMELDDFVSALGAEEELQPGQLYFLLPVSMLQRPLHADEIAALAVKASAALVETHKGPLVFPYSGPKTRGGAEITTRRSKKGCAKGRDFASRLSAIPE
ncbi:uncharacterized protein [Typha latifolia]|uniref:uncharacterized protein n=1 Tax=Typha latifolia TaxID=4733 RepID=UPI003C2D3515